MATVRNGKMTGRIYQHDQTVEQADPTTPDERMGNKTDLSARSIYRYWNAAYRGFVPHGVRLPSPTQGDIEQYEDDPDTFEEDSIAEPAVDIETINDYEVQDWQTATFNVTTVPVLIGGVDPTRTLLRLVNLGPGLVWVAHSENLGNQGFPLIPMTTQFYDLEIHTTQEVWAVQQTAQTSAAQLSVIREYTKEFHQ